MVKAKRTRKRRGEGMKKKHTICPCCRTRIEIKPDTLRDDGWLWCATCQAATVKLLRTIGEWFDVARERFGEVSGVGLVGLEQAYYQSVAYKVCVRCLAHHNVVRQTSRALVASSDHYLCQPCLSRR